MANKPERISVSITDDVMEALEKLDRLVAYHKRRGSRKKAIRSYWIRKFLMENIDEEIEKAERQRGEEFGLEKMEIGELHELKKESVIDEFIDKILHKDDQ